VTELLGKMLRINVNVPDSHETGFVIPPGNPGFPRPEIWSLGLLNPWKFSFDDPSKGGTGAMVIGDVGQGVIEEIDYEPAGHAGRNYGWRNYEGTRENLMTEPLASAPTFPVFQYGRDFGRSITGGYVYRGNMLPGMRGRYFFADFATRRVASVLLSVHPSGEASASEFRDHTAELGGTGVVGGVSGFGVDAAGEIYILNYNTGTVLRLLPAAPPPPPAGLRIIR
jgi:glucose/arabinose dehydrogenase